MPNCCGWKRADDRKRVFSDTNIAAIRLVLDRQNRLVGAPRRGLRSRSILPDGARLYSSLRSQTALRGRSWRDLKSPVQRCKFHPASPEDRLKCSQPRSLGCQAKIIVQRHYARNCRSRQRRPRRVADRQSASLERLTQTLETLGAMLTGLLLSTLAAQHSQSFPRSVITSSAARTFRAVGRQQLPGLCPAVVRPTIRIRP